MATGPDTDISLLSLADAKEYLGSTGSTSNDSKISDDINSVSLRMKLEAGRNLKATSYTETYDGDGSNELLLQNWPISSTTITITIDNNRAFTDTDDQVTGTDIMLDTEMGLVRLDDDSFSKGTQNVQVEYSAGYSTASAYDLTNAAKEFLQVMWNRRVKKETVALRSESYEGISRTYETDLPWSVKQVLTMYRDRGIG